MARAQEILFIDTAVSDRETILRNLRPEVHAIVLDARWSAARQMAAALEGREGLDAVHIMAHGAPGRVSFAAGDWSAETLEDEADDLAAIGDALGRDGNLLMWSCQVGEGARGRSFVDALSRATGSPVAAATDLVGSPGLVGRWELEARPPHATVPPPLTDAGLAGYAGVFSVNLISTGAGERHAIFGRWPVDTAAGTYFIVLNNSGTLQAIGQFIVPVNSAGTFAISEALPAGSYTLGSKTAGPGTIAVYSGIWNPGGQAEGTWSLGNFNPSITATLNDTRDTNSNHSHTGAA
jgi:hypothetical protein